MGRRDGPAHSPLVDPVLLAVLGAAVFTGGATVMQQTRERLAALGWRWRELRMLWDVDRPEDLVRLEAARPLAGRA